MCSDIKGKELYLLKRVKRVERGGGRERNIGKTKEQKRILETEQEQL